jgi:hypothetical protein
MTPPLPDYAEGSPVPDGPVSVDPLARLSDSIKRARLARRAEATARDDLDAARNALRTEFGDPITVWGKTGPEAWDTILGMLTAAGWKPPGTTFDVCGHGRRRTESCILCERTAP